MGFIAQNPGNMNMTVATDSRRIKNIALCPLVHIWMSEDEVNQNIRCGVGSCSTPESPSR